MSTPPPFPTPVQPDAQPVQPGLSESARVINIFFGPRKTFEDLKRNASWWKPWLLSAVFSLIFGLIAVQKIDMVRFARQQIEHSKMAQRQMEQLSPEQQEQNLRIRASFTKVIFLIYPVFSLLIGLIVAAILMVVFNFGFAAEVPFQRALAIVFYAYLPGILAAILLSVSLLLSPDPSAFDLNGNPIATNPGFFMDPQGNKFLYGLASGLDVFKIWLVVLLGLGFAAASPNRKLTAGKAITTMFVIYAILVIGGAAVSAAF